MAEGDRNNHIAPEDLSAYADGEALAPWERERIERHLEACEVCRQELAELSAIQQLLSELPEPEVPRSFRLSPEDVETEPPGPVPTPIQPWLLRHQTTFRVAAMAAALLLALVVTIDLLPSGSDDDESADMETMDAPRQEAAQEEAVQEEAAQDGAQEDAAEPAPGAGRDEADDSASTAGDADMDTADDSVEEEAPAVQEDAAPPDDDDAAAPESDGSGPGESGGADQDAVEEAPEVAEEEEEEVPAAGDESAQVPAVEDDSEGVSDRDPAGAEDGFRLQEASEAEDDTGMSTLRLVAIALAVVTVILAAVGFLVPRWWKSSSRT